MEKILKDLLFINDKDVFTDYGAFLVEDKSGDNSNYSALLKPPSMKAYTTVEFREQDGERLPDTLPEPRFEARDVTLYFAIVADTTAQWVEHYKGFIQLLKSGWLNIKLPELNKTYRMYYKECSSYDQLIYFKEEEVYASRFKVKFREPEPTI